MLENLQIMQTKQNAKVIRVLIVSPMSLDISTKISKMMLVTYHESRFWDVLSRSVNISLHLNPTLAWIFPDTAPAPKDNQHAPDFPVDCF